MALQLRNDAARGPGFALLVFDRAIDTPSLEISLFDRFRQLYLGPSAPERPNWQTRPHYFLIVRTSGDGRRTTYSVAPDITTFVPDGALVEIATADSRIREEVGWNNILLHFGGPEISGWVFSPPNQYVCGGQVIDLNGDDEKNKREEERKKQEEEDRKKQEEAERKKREEEEKRKEEERKKGKDTKDRDDTKPPRRRLGRALALLALLLLAACGSLATYFNADLICSRFGVLCSAPPRSDPEADLYRQAVSCADSRQSNQKFCDVSACFDDFRRRFPASTRLNAEQARLSNAAQSCEEASLHEQAVACAVGRETARQFCEVNACFDDLRRRFPNSARLNGEGARLRRAADQCGIVRERALFEQAVACANTKEPLASICELEACYGPLRNAFPNSTLLNGERARIETARERCVMSQEAQVLAAADQCASSRPCDTACYGTYRSRFPNGKLKGRADAAVNSARNACEAQSLPVRVPRTTENPTVRCDQLRKPSDYLICDDGEIARADEEMGKAYRRKIEPMNQADRDSLQALQNQWATQRDRACNIPLSGPFNTLDSRRFKRCLIGQTEARKSQL